MNTTHTQVHIGGQSWRSSVGEINGSRCGKMHCHHPECAWWALFILLHAPSQSWGWGGGGVTVILRRDNKEVTHPRSQLESGQCHLVTSLQKPSQLIKSNSWSILHAAYQYIKYQPLHKRLRNVFQWSLIYFRRILEWGGFEAYWKLQPCCGVRDVTQVYT